MMGTIMQQAVRACPPASGAVTVRRRSVVWASKTLAALCAAISLCAGTARPADAQAAASWTGCYAGLNGGWGWNNGSVSYNDPNADADPINRRPDLAGGVDAYIPTPTSLNGSGGLAGLQGGCNWQLQQWVVGAEADLDFGHIAGSGTTSANSGPLLAYKTGSSFGFYTSIDDTGTASEQASVRWLSTVRARSGFAIQQNLLLYGTGGLAIGGVTTQGSITTSSPFPGFVNPAWSGANSTVKVGGVVGGGLEWAFSDRWTLKSEYLWYDLGSISHPLNCSISGCPGVLDPTLGSVSTSIFGSIVRVGINYKFQ
jgi:outer membrane immunogenic protein